MQKIYRVHKEPTAVEMHIHQIFIPRVHCELWETPESEDYIEPGKEKRFVIMRMPDKYLIGQLALRFIPQGTELLVTDEPYSVQKGQDFDTEAFTEFHHSLLESIPWRKEQIS
ncbi:MAG: hypothetical protein ACE5II_00660 [Anaerolineae bacterium]